MTSTYSLKEIGKAPGGKRVPLRGLTSFQSFSSTDFSVQKQLVLNCSLAPVHLPWDVLLASDFTSLKEGGGDCALLKRTTTGVAIIV